VGGGGGGGYAQADKRTDGGQESGAAGRPGGAGKGSAFAARARARAAAGRARPGLRWHGEHGPPAAPGCARSRSARSSRGLRSPTPARPRHQGPRPRLRAPSPAAGGGGGCRRGDAPDAPARDVPVGRRASPPRGRLVRCERSPLGHALRSSLRPRRERRLFGICLALLAVPSHSHVVGNGGPSAASSVALRGTRLAVQGLTRCIIPFVLPFWPSWVRFDDMAKR